MCGCAWKLQVKRYKSQKGRKASHRPVCTSSLSWCVLLDTQIIWNKHIDITCRCPFSKESVSRQVTAQVTYLGWRYLQMSSQLLELVSDCRVHNSAVLSMILIIRTVFLLFLRASFPFQITTPSCRRPMYATRPVPLRLLYPSPSASAEHWVERPLAENCRFWSHSSQWSTVLLFTMPCSGKRWTPIAMVTAKNI